MQISSILGKRSNPLQSSKRSDIAALLTGQKPAEAGSTSASKQVLAQALAGSDLTHITPSEFSALLGRLRQAHAINEQEFRELGQIRGDLEQAEVGANEPVNLQEFYNSRVSKLQQRIAAIRDDDPTAASQRAVVQQELTAVQKRQQWVQKFALLQESANQTGVDMAV